MIKSVAIINCFDSIGSTGKISTGLNNYLKSIGLHSMICYGFGEGGDKSNYRIGCRLEKKIHSFLGKLFGLEGFFSFFSTLRLLNHLRKNNVDTIIGVCLHHFFINYDLLFHFMGKNDINFVYLMIDEYPFLGKCCYKNECEHYKCGCGNCPAIKEYPKSFFLDTSSLIYRHKKKLYSKVLKKVFVAPEYVINCSKESPLMNGIKTAVVDEAIDTEFFHPRNTDNLKKELGIGKEKIVIVCVALYPASRKGGEYFVKLARQMENNDKYVFVHVGVSETHIEEFPSNYIRVGFVKDQNQLAEFYSMGDLFIFPSLLDTMPNTCLEALSCGTPLLCFNVSGMPYIATKDVASFVEVRNVEQMIEIVEKVTPKQIETITRCRQYALGRYNNRDYYKKIVELANDLDAL